MTINKIMIKFINYYNQIPESIIVSKQIFGITYGYKNITISPYLREALALQCYNLHITLKDQLNQVK